MSHESTSAGPAKSWLITGCSSGFGRSLARAALYTTNLFGPIGMMPGPGL